LIGCLWRTPETYHQAGIRRGTATSNFHAQRDNLVTTTLETASTVAWPTSVSLHAVFGGSSGKHPGLVAPTAESESGAFVPLLVVVRRLWRSGHEVPGHHKMSR